MTKAELSAAELQAYARRAITQLNNAVRTLRIHEPTAPSVTSVLEALAGSLNGLADHFDASVRLEVASDVVFVNEVRVRITATSAAQVEVLEGELRSRNIGGLTFQRPVRVEAIRTFLAAFARKAESAEDRDRLLRQLTTLGRDFGVELLESRALLNAEEAAETTRDPKQAALEIYARLVVAFDTFVATLEDGGDPLEGRLGVVRLAQELVDLTAERTDHLLSLPLLRRANAAAFDKAVPRYASAHAAQTAVWAALIGRALELDRLALLDLGVSALLGDIGFALLPESLTDRQGTMGPDELRELQRAMTRATGALLGHGRIDEAMKRHLVVAYEHHGYYVDPDTGAPADMHVLSRITAVACAFDAMTSARPWRPAMTQKKALEILRREAGTRFDPVVVHALSNVLTTYAGALTFAQPSP
jgi:HD-GYP domain-containing protein (c-di-GMP phosphodiesterase class II)